MKRLAVISEIDPKDKNLHSGIIYSICRQLEKYFQVTYVIPPRNRNNLARHFWSVAYPYFAKRFLHQDITHNIGVAKAYGKFINSKLAETDYDAVFAFDCQHLAYLETDRPVFYRSDAIYPLMVDYYFFNVPKFAYKQGVAIEQRALENVTCMFSTNGWVKEGVKKFYPHISIDKICVVHSGANIADPGYDKNATRHVHSPLRLVFIGSNPKRKGIDAVLECLKYLNKELNRPTQLTAIGGDINEFLDEEARTWVNYLGWINKNDDQQAQLFTDSLKQADLMLFPTRAECSPIANCEAAAYALPVFTYDTGGVSSYIHDGENGRLLPLSASGKDFAIAINETTPEQLQQYSVNARQLYETTYNWDAWGEKVSKTILSSL